MIDLNTPQGTDEMLSEPMKKHRSIEVKPRRQSHPWVDDRKALRTRRTRRIGFFNQNQRVDFQNQENNIPASSNAQKINNIVGVIWKDISKTYDRSVFFEIATEDFIKRICRYARHLNASIEAKAVAFLLLKNRQHDLEESHIEQIIKHVNSKNKAVESVLTNYFDAQIDEFLTKESSINISNPKRLIDQIRAKRETEKEVSRCARDMANYQNNITALKTNKRDHTAWGVLYSAAEKKLQEARRRVSEIANAFDYRQEVPVGSQVTLHLVPKQENALNDSKNYSRASSIHSIHPNNSYSFEKNNDSLSNGDEDTSRPRKTLSNKNQFPFKTKYPSNPKDSLVLSNEDKKSIISEKIDDDKKKNVNYAKSLFNGKNYYQKKEYINDGNNDNFVDYKKDDTGSINNLNNTVHNNPYMKKKLGTFTPEEFNEYLRNNNNELQGKKKLIKGIERKDKKNHLKPYQIDVKHPSETIDLKNNEIYEQDELTKKIMTKKLPTLTSNNSNDVNTSLNDDSTPSFKPKKKCNSTDSIENIANRESDDGSANLDNIDEKISVPPMERRDSVSKFYNKENADINNHSNSSLLNDNKEDNCFADLEGMFGY